MNSTSNKNKVCAVIPFYNECGTIRKIIEGTLNYVDLVITVNDGSTDNSLELIQDIENVIILSFDKNKGKGAALKHGFEECISAGYDVCVALDADFQHPPEYIPFLIKEIGAADVVIGSRMKDFSRMPFQRILSNKLTSFLLSVKTGEKISDSQCGYRAYSVSALKEILPTYTGFEAESEMIVYAARRNYKIKFVYIPTIYGSEKSKMKPLEAIYGFIKVLFR